jgi:hypothetical protein
MIQNSLTASSREQYAKVWFKFKDFNKNVLNNQQVIPIDQGKLLLFLAHLHSEGLSKASIISAVSSLNYIQKAAGGQDLTKLFFVSKFLQGLKKSSVLQDLRLPITPPILSKLCEAAEKLFPVHTAHLLKAMYLLCFHAFLRIGEITVQSTTKQNANLLHVSQISLNHITNCVSVTFYKFKHSSSDFPFQLNIKCLKQKDGYNLLFELAQYLVIRKMTPGPLFMHRDKPITKSVFCDHLNQCLKFAKIDHKFYKSHSFRIGAASTALQKGYSHEQIQKMGRWKSDAYKKYLRVQSFELT